MKEFMLKKIKKYFRDNSFLDIVRDIIGFTALKEPDDLNKKKHLSAVWGISVISVCVYAATILAQYGYAGYFYIPQDFITYSIRDNIIYFFQLFSVAFIIAKMMGWWLWVMTIALGLLIYALWHKNMIFIVFVGLLMWGSYNFGSWIAVNSPSHHTLSEGCINSESLYIVPVFYDGKVVLVPVDKDTKKMRGGFLVRDVAKLDCLIERKAIGKITR